MIEPIVIIGLISIIYCYSTIIGDKLKERRRKTNGRKMSNAYFVSNTRRKFSGAQNVRSTQKRKES